MNNIDAELSALLPPIALELIRIIGLTETLQLVEVYGGTAIWVPKNAVQGHPHADEIGYAAWAKLCSYAGDTYLEVPMCKRVLAKAQDRQIMAEAETLTDKVLARKYQTTERQIRRIRARSGVVAASASLDLFNDLINAA